MKNEIDFEKAYGYISIDGEGQFIKTTPDGEWELFTVDDDTVETYKKGKTRWFRKVKKTKPEIITLRFKESKFKRFIKFILKFTHYERDKKIFKKER